jgi:hypothetical protein
MGFITLERNTIREQAIAETPARRFAAGREVLYPLSYRRMERRTGFEPATTRFGDEVTAIFTTDREESWRGTGDAVAALAGGPPFGVRDSNPLGAVAPFPRSNRHLHHRLADACAAAIEGHAGERAISAPVTASQALLSEDLRCGAWQPLQGRLHSACVKGVGGAKYPTSSPPASVEPLEAANQNYEINCRGALNGAPHGANPSRFALPSVSGLRLVPSDRPRALRPRAFPREPRDPGLPFRLAPGYFERAVPRKIKNPPERLAREGP